MSQYPKSSDELRSEALLEVERIQAERELNDLKDALQHDYVLRLFWRILTRYGRLYEISFNNTGWTNFYEGARNVGLSIVAELQKADPAILAKMGAMNIDTLNAAELSTTKLGESDD